MTPEIPLVAWHYAIEFNEDRLPVPEPAFTNGEEDGRYSKTPDEEIDSDVPSRVNGAAMTLKKSEEEDEGVVKEGEENL